MSYEILNDSDRVAVAFQQFADDVKAQPSKYLSLIRKRGPHFSSGFLNEVNDRFQKNKFDTSHLISRGMIKPSVPGVIT
jgi:hypothetical protein